jgi:hypothetical protein
VDGLAKGDHYFEAEPANCAITALVMDLTLVTADEGLLKLPNIKTLASRQAVHEVYRRPSSDKLLV